MVISNVIKICIHKLVNDKTNKRASHLRLTWKGGSREVEFQ